MTTGTGRWAVRVLKGQSVAIPTYFSHLTKPTNYLLKPDFNHPGQGVSNKRSFSCHKYQLLENNFYLYKVDGNADSLKLQILYVRYVLNTVKFA